MYMPLFITRSALDNAIEESAAEIQETLLTLVTKEEFNKLDAKVSTLDTKVSTLDSKVTALDLKVSNLDSKVTALDTKIDAVEARLEAKMDMHHESNVKGLDNLARQITRIMDHMGIPREVEA